MAKKKVNERKDYSYEAKKSLPKYKKSSIQRKTQFLILRGPGLVQASVMAENEVLKSFALLKHKKLKFVQIKVVEDAVRAISDANTWAAGIVFQPGQLVDESGLIQKTLKRILIDSKVVSGEGSIEDTLREMIESQDQKEN